MPRKRQIMALIVAWSGDSAILLLGILYNVLWALSVGTGLFGLLATCTYQLI